MQVVSPESEFSTFDPSETKNSPSRPKQSPKCMDRYREYTLQKVMTAEEGNQKIQANNAGDIFTGGHSLRVYQRRGDSQIVHSTSTNEVRPFIELLTVSAGLLVLEKWSGDLVLYDRGFRELSRLEGKGGLGDKYSSGLCGGNGDYYTWTRADHSLCIVRTTNPLKITATLPSFFGSQLEDVEPLCAISSVGGGSQMGIVLSQQIYWLVAKTPLGHYRREAFRVNKHLPLLKVLENCQGDQDIVFAGGSTAVEGISGQPAVQAIYFELGRQHIDYLELRTSTDRLHGSVEALRRADGLDVLFAGVGGSVFVLEWTGTHLCMLNFLGGVHSTGPLSLCPLGSSQLYISSGRDRHFSLLSFNTK